MAEIRRTHSAFIQLPDGGHAFIDGIPNDHICDDRGDVEMYTASGKTVKWHTVRAWASLTYQARRPLLYSHFEKLMDPICGESSTCSICGSSSMGSWRDYDF